MIMLITPSKWWEGEYNFGSFSVTSWEVIRLKQNKNVSAYKKSKLLLKKYVYFL